MDFYAQAKFKCSEWSFVWDNHVGKSLFEGKKFYTRDHPCSIWISIVSFFCSFLLLLHLKLRGGQNLKLQILKWWLSTSGSPQTSQVVDVSKIDSLLGCTMKHNMILLHLYSRREIELILLFCWKYCISLKEKSTIFETCGAQYKWLHANITMFFVARMHGGGGGGWCMQATVQMSKFNVIDDCSHWQYCSTYCKSTHNVQHSASTTGDLAQRFNITRRQRGMTHKSHSIDTHPDHASTCKLVWVWIHMPRQCNQAKSIQNRKKNSALCLFAARHDPRTRASTFSHTVGHMTHWMDHKCGQKASNQRPSILLAWAIHRRRVHQHIPLCRGSMHPTHTPGHSELFLCKSTLIKSAKGHIGLTGFSPVQSFHAIAGHCCIRAIR